jgi:histidinol-phosphate aminotransferase
MRDCFSHLPALDRVRIPPTPESEMRLHRLERPVSWGELEDEIRHTMPDLHFYPDYAPFHAELAGWLGVDQSKVVLGQGIESLIRDLVMLCIDPGDGLAFTYPTCAMFDIYAQVFRADVVRIYTDPDRPLTVGDVKASLRPGVKLVILPNPGQPVDVCFATDEIAFLAGYCESIGAVLAIDEAYHGFGAPTATGLIDRCPNLVVLRTFSKAFGAASIRVGYAVGSGAIVRGLNGCRQSGEVAGASLHAAGVLLDRWASHVEPGIAEIVAGRDWLANALERAGYRARGQYANHVLIDLGSVRMARKIHRRLKERGVNVRLNAAPCDRHLMVTCGPLDMMHRFYTEFRGAVIG